MSKKVGEKIYMYTMMNGKFNVREGTIEEDECHRKFIVYPDFGRDSYYFRATRRGFGIIINGITLYLEDRNDELAKRLFIEHEENDIAELEEKIGRKLENIKMLKD